MIKRYQTKEMAKIWTEKAKYKSWLDVEIAAVKAFVELGEIPSSDYKKILDNANFNVKEIEKLELETKHDVIAFTRNVSSYLGEERKWIHFGLTSTDVVDTAQSIRIKKANNMIQKKLNNLLSVLKESALRYKESYQIGRTHGVHAEITTFGYKIATYYDELSRNIKRFKMARKDIEACKISGAVGNYANIEPQVQELISKYLKLNSTNTSTQVLQRDNHIFYLTTLGLIASLIEKIATEIRHLQKTEVREVFEKFSKNQKGSSAMPHKQNPITSENLTGLSRIMRSYIGVSFENNILWHERDISHSSTERIIIPDACLLIDYMITRFTNMFENIYVDEKQMLDNIYSTNGVIFSQRVLLFLIKDKSYSREDAYDLIQPIAIQSFDKRENFRDNLLKNKIITNAEAEIIFDMKYAKENIENSFKKLKII